MTLRFLAIFCFIIGAQSVQATNGMELRDVSRSRVAPSAINTLPETRLVRSLSELTSNYRTKRVRSSYFFGMLMPGRHDEINGNPYGFNGMERDEEVKGVGNSYDFGARMHNPRLGRWLSVGPLQAKYPNLSAYSFAANNFVFLVDPEGRKIAICHEVGGKKHSIVLKKPNEVELLKYIDNKFVQTNISQYVHENTTKKLDQKNQINHEDVPVDKKQLTDKSRDLHSVKNKRKLFDDICFNIDDLFIPISLDENASISSITIYTMSFSIDCMRYGYSFMDVIEIVKRKKNDKSFQFIKLSKKSDLEKAACLFDTSFDKYDTRSVYDLRLVVLLEYSTGKTDTVGFDSFIMLINDDLYHRDENLLHFFLSKTNRIIRKSAKSSRPRPSKKATFKDKSF